jgi:hypothetical protein
MTFIRRKIGCLRYVSFCQDCAATIASTDSHEELDGHESAHICTHKVASFEQFFADWTMA